MRKKKSQEEFEKELYKINSDIEILGKYINARSLIHCKCKIDKYEWNTTPTDLLRGTGCPVCVNKKIVIGINDMWTTNPDLAKLLVNPEDGYKYTQCSDHKIDWKCPNCGNIIKNRRISSINRQRLYCPICDDGIKYPEKFMYYLLKQLDIDFEYQKKFDWCTYEFKGKKKYGLYDFYISSMNLIIEMDGGWHNKDNNMSGQTKDESKYIDNIKNILANENNTIVTRIDCNKSDFNYIKQNILNSKLNNLLNLSKINWDKLNKDISKNLIKQVCDLWNSKRYSTYEISNKMKLGYTTILNYLHSGNKIGLCHYDSYEELVKNASYIWGYNKRKVICLNTNEIFNSIKEAAEIYIPTHNHSHIIACCTYREKSAGKHPITGEKLHWMYYEDYLKLQNMI